MPRLARIGGACLLALLAAAPPAVLSALTPSAGLQRAVVLAKPALVHVVVDVTGSLRDVGDGSLHGPVHDTLSGTGWFADPDGDVVTAAHVGAPSDLEIKQSLVRAYIVGAFCPDRSVCDQVIATRFAALMSSTRPEHVRVGLRVLTQDVSMKPGATAADAFRAGRDARVLTASPTTVKDLAVLHVDSANDPVALVAAQAAPVGGAIAVMGFPPASTFSVPPTFDYGTVVTSRRGVTGFGLPTDPTAAGIAAEATVIRVDAYAEHGDSGGPAVDAGGRVIGLVSFGADPNGPLRAAFLISAGDIAEVLVQAGVSNHLGPADETWRSGLAAYDHGDRAGALADFRACAAASAINVGCRQWIAIAGAAPNGGGAPVLVIVLAVVAVAGAVGGAGAVWTARRRRRARDVRALFRA